MPVNKSNTPKSPKEQFGSQSQNSPSLTKTRFNKPINPTGMLYGQLPDTGSPSGNYGVLPGLGKDAVSSNHSTQTPQSASYGVIPGASNTIASGTNPNKYGVFPPNHQ